MERISRHVEMVSVLVSVKLTKLAITTGKVGDFDENM